MAVGVKISQLPVATSTDGTELAVIVQQGETRQVTIDQFVAPVATSINAEVSLKAYRTGDYLDAVQYIEFDTSAAIPTSVGRLSWNLDDGTLNLGLIGGNVVNQLGQELVQRCYNNTGSPITEGSVVKVVGATGQRLTIELAEANNDANSLTVIGVATETIPDKALGYVATEGFVRGINTQGFTDGDVLWLSPTIPGKFTATKPVAPQHLVMVGYVVKGGSVGAGSIFVKVQNGYELGELHDVKVSASTSLANNEILAYNTSAGVWTNSTLLIDVQNSVSALTDRVATVSAATSVNAATVSALEIRVSAVSAQASANAAAIVSTNNVVSALELRVSAVSAAVSTLSQQVQALDVSAVNVRLDQVSAAVSVVAASVSALEIRVSAVSAVAAAATGSITSVNNVVSALEVRVSGVSARTSVNAAAITSVNNVVSVLEVRVSGVSALTSVNAAAITSINNIVSALEIRVSTVSTRGSTLAASITSVNNVVSALEIRVSSVSAAVVVVSAAITSVNAVVSLKVNRSGDTMTGPLNVVVSSDIIGVSLVGGLVVTSVVNFTGDSAVKVPAGTTATRPTSAVPGQIRFNSGSNTFEGYVSAEWGAIGGGGGATGGGNDQIFFLNDQVVSVSYTIPTGKNAGTFGPISIASGVTVVVPTSSVWTVV